MPKSVRRERARAARVQRGSCCAVMLLAACGGGSSEHSASDAPDAPATALVGRPTYVGPETSVEAIRTLNTGEQVTTRDGAMSTFLQLLQAPQTASAPTQLDNRRTEDTSYPEWRALSLGDSATTPPALASQLDEAQRQLVAQTATDNDLVPALQALRTIFPSQQHEPPTQHFVSYRPERARWLSEEFQGSEGGTYAENPGLAEFRQRGARLYCAVKNAADEQAKSADTRIMGKKSLIDFKILKQHIQMMTVEPTLTVQPPMRLDSGSNDGAQAFVLPFLAGVRLTPIPHLPTLPEMRVPVVALTTDSEVNNALVGENFRQKWSTATNLMKFASSSYASKIETADITLFTVGPVSFRANLGLSAGVTSCAEQEGYESCKQNPQTNVGRLLEGYRESPDGPLLALVAPGRGLRTDKPEYGWTNDDPARPVMGGDYNDGPWSIDTSRWWASVQSPGLVPFPITLPDPLAARMLQDNDKSLSVVTNYGLSLTISGNLGMRLPEQATSDDFYVEVLANLKLRTTYSTSIVHRFREQEELQARSHHVSTPEFEADLLTGSPLTALTVTPGVQSEPLKFELGGGVKINIHIPWLGTLGTSVNVMSAPLQAEPGPADWWTERNRLRLTTMQSFEGVLQENLASHLPATPWFASFENQQACAAPQPRPPSVPPRCGGAPAALNTPPAVPLCFAAPVQLNAPDRWDDPALFCYQVMEPFLKSGTFLEQPYHASSWIARVLEAPDDFQKASQAVLACAEEYRKRNRQTEVIHAYTFAACDDRAELDDNPIALNVNPVPGALPNGANAPCNP